MERLFVRFSRHLSMKYSTNAFPSVLRKIANPLPIGRLIHENQGNANAPLSSAFSRVSPVRLVAPALDAFHVARAVNFLKLWPRVPVATFGAGATVCKPLGNAQRVSRVQGYIVPAFFTRNHVSKAQPRLNAGYNRIGFNASAIRQIGSEIGFSVYRHLAGYGLISGLLAPRRPSAIFGRIRAVVVDTVNAVSDRPLAHIASEGGKGAPLLANLNPATAVVLEPRMAGVGAALPHVRPRSIKGMRVLKRHDHSPFVPFTIIPSKGNEYAS